MNTTQLKHVSKRLWQPFGYVNGVPVVLAFEIDNLAQWYCPFCHVFHAHGNSPGVRASHCFRGDSLLYNRDYHLVIVRCV